MLGESVLMNAMNPIKGIYRTGTTFKSHPPPMPEFRFTSDTVVVCESYAIVSRGNEEKRIIFEELVARGLNALLKGSSKIAELDTFTLFSEQL